LREPSIGDLIGAPLGARGLADYLADADANFSDCVLSEVLPSLSVMSAGRRIDNPQELIAGARFGALMEFCSREYDLTVVDTPATDRCSDARRVSTVAGYSLVVARRDATLVADLWALVEQLLADHATTVGAVLNDF
jgi:protein-tyrosine kinase